MNKNNPKIHDKDSKDNILIVGKVKTGNINIEENKAFEIEGELELAKIFSLDIETSKRPTLKPMSLRRNRIG